jgi:hypothetical protein
MNRAAIYRPEARGVIRRHGPHFDHPLSGAVALVYVFRLRTALSGIPESSLVGVIHAESIAAILLTGSESPVPPYVDVSRPGNNCQERPVKGRSLIEK